MTVMAAATAGILNPGTDPVKTRTVGIAPNFPKDTVIYPRDAYKLNRKGDFEEIKIADSLLNIGVESDSLVEDVTDTLPRLTARDTIKVPDSLKLIDPFRYKYYVALLDSLTHVIVRDSLRHRSDSISSAPDSIRVPGDTLSAYLDSLDWRKLDSLYASDSTFRAKAAFIAWYNSLSKKERKNYDLEQKQNLKRAEMDSITTAKEEAQAIKDSIIENTPRILEAYAIPDSMMYKRIITWTEDRDFGRVDKLHVPDTDFNYRFYDYRWQREDVNATWLGTAGSPVQKYDFFQRGSREGITFYDAMENWSYDPGNLPHYNTKTPYTELSYYGTILGSKSLESDNLHLFTTQNITPSFNFQLMYDRFGGGGFLENEETKNNTGVVAANYLGKNYTLHAGYIHNTIKRGESGGIQRVSDVRDTVIDARSIDIALKNASSRTDKNTFFVDQQFRIPFNFINKIKAKKDSSFKYNADSLDRNITTAYVGHSSDLTFYKRSYQDVIGTSESFARSMYNNTFLYDQGASSDTLKVMKLENKVYMRLQPWGADAAVSKLDVGIGDKLMTYRDSTSKRPLTHTENSAYLYAGAEGLIGKYVSWDARGSYTFAGARFGDFLVEGNASLNFYPFRRARKSPVTVSAHFETSLTEPDYYQKCMNANHYSWYHDDFTKSSATKIQGRIDVPYWKLSLDVGYALLAGTIYYDSTAVVRQHSEAMSVMSAALTKNFVFGPLHLDNRLLFQLSSNQDVVPVPMLAVNCRWYFQFILQKDPTRTYNILEMQIGANAWYNTQWHSPAWNPNLGVFYNQKDNLYENGPVFDFFINMQWKKAVIFIKYQNGLKGWPMKESRDYFCANRYILDTPGTKAFTFDILKIGIYWPFYIQPAKLKGNALKAANEGKHQ